MDNTTLDRNTQDQTSKLGPREMAATLAHATHLHEQVLSATHPAQSETTPQISEAAPASAEEAPQQDEAIDLETKMEAKMEILRTEMKDTIKTEIGSIRDEIKSALGDGQK